MFATGKGNADKVRMVDTFDNMKPLFDYRPNLNFLIDNKRPKSRYDTPRQDIIDAYFIAELLRNELKAKFRKDLQYDTNAVKIMNRVTNANPIKLMEREFICRV